MSTSPQVGAGRETGDRDVAVTVPTQASRANRTKAKVLTEKLPLHRAIMVVDIEGSTRRTNPAKGLLRKVMYDLLEKSFTTAGISQRIRDEPQDRGDGAMFLVHPVDRAPQALLLTKVIPTLARLLSRHGAEQPEHRFRMRVSVHAGDVHYDARGVFGESLDIACRLVDAPQVKHQLTASGRPLVVVVSDRIYDSVVKHGYLGIDQQSFQPITAAEVAGQQVHGWVQVPSE